MLQNEASAVKVMSLSISLEPLWKLSYFLDAHFKSIMICRRFNAMLLCFWHFILVHSEGNEAYEKNRDIRRHAELFPLFLFLDHYFHHFGLSLSKPCNETKQFLHSELRGICFHPKYVQLRAYSTWREWVCVCFLLALKESNCYKSFEAGTLALIYLFYTSNTGLDWMDLI